MDERLTDNAYETDPRFKWKHFMHDAIPVPIKISIQSRSINQTLLFRAIINFQDLFFNAIFFRSWKRNIRISTLLHPFRHSVFPPWIFTPMFERSASSKSNDNHATFFNRNNWIENERIISFGSIWKKRNDFLVRKQCYKLRKGYSISLVIRRFVIIDRERWDKVGWRMEKKE